MTDHQALDLLIKKLRTRQQTVGFAESCTGGLLSATLASHAGVSDVFKGAVVSYANQAKEDLLQVSPITLKLMGAVSDLTVR
ncbi:MAG: damage-inducible protein CinA, partial [Bdellovibrio sp. CG10_big_fil_rev_8_21_14_0_10_47_8]